MEIKGKIYKIGDEEQVSATFKKRLLVVETDEKYSQKIPIDFVQDKIDLIDPYKVGENVTVSINLRGNEYNGKFYVNLQGWKIARDAQQAPPAPAPQAPTNNEEQEDVPF